jgi:hypothetical protein
VIENYVRRRSYEPGSVPLIKSIVDPTRVKRGDFTSHSFIYPQRGRAVDEHKRPIEWPYEKTTFSISRLRINHYSTKSEEELRAKLDLWTTTSWPRGEREIEGWLERLDAEPDDAILAYVPALHDALARLPAVPEGGVTGG